MAESKFGKVQRRTHLRQCGDCGKKMQEPHSITVQVFTRQHNPGKKHTYGRSMGSHTRSFCRSCAKKRFDAMVKALDA